MLLTYRKIEKATKKEQQSSFGLHSTIFMRDWIVPAVVSAFLAPSAMINLSVQDNTAQER